jgi:hypothetical protein
MKGNARKKGTDPFPHNIKSPAVSPQSPPSGEVDVACDPGFPGAVEKPDEGGSFGGTGLTAENQDNARMGDVLRFGHEVFPVAGDDHIAPFGGVAQDSRIIGPDGKDIAQHDDLVP